MTNIRPLKKDKMMIPESKLVAEVRSISPRKLTQPINIYRYCFFSLIEYSIAEDKREISTIKAINDPVLKGSPSWFINRISVAAKNFTVKGMIPNRMSETITKEAVRKRMNFKVDCLFSFLA